MGNVTPSQKRLIVIGLGLILVLLLAKQFLLKKSVPEAIPVVAPVHHVQPPAKAAKPKAHHKAVVHVDQSLPAALRRELARHPVVVAILYSQGADDAEALQAARQGAQGAHVGFAVLDVGKESVAKAMALKAPGTADPSVLVVRRPGTISFLLPGYADPEAVAEAARNAR